MSPTHAFLALSSANSSYFFVCADESYTYKYHGYDMIKTSMKLGKVLNKQGISSFAEKLTLKSCANRYAFCPNLFLSVSNLLTILSNRH